MITSLQNKVDLTHINYEKTPNMKNKLVKVLYSQF